jgi:NAD(P)-dependent dehydrogenase (short-subunit alcohol dehydrogenase family)
MELRNRVAIVTGGGSGIGEALCRRFADEGARRVVVADLNGAEAKRVAAALPSGVGIAEPLDVADENAIRALVQRTLAQGPIDVFVSNAGFVSRGGLEEGNEVLNRMWAVHVMAHVYAARAVLPSMIARGEGYLLNTASAAGLLTQIGSVAYAVTKAAAVALAEWLAITHYHQGIRVSVLCPQAVRTNIVRDLPEMPGIASQDGVLEPEQLAETVIECLRQERFLVLPHPEVQTYLERKAVNRDRWLAGMRRFQDRLFAGMSLPGDWLVK